MKLTNLLIILIFCMLPAHGFAGKLDDFEKKASSPKTSKTSSSQSSSSSCRGVVYCLFEDFFLEVFFDMGHLLTYELLRAGHASSMRFSGQVGDTHLLPRRMGEALIPKFRIDSHYQALGEDVDAIDFRFELGSGPVGIDLRQTGFRESSTFDSLRITEFFIQYRMSFGNHTGMNMGFGTLKMSGNEDNHGFAFSMPLYWHEKHVGLEFRPVFSSINGNSIEDYDFRFMLKQKISSIQLGYRSLHAPDETLEGPYIGLSFHW